MRRQSLKNGNRPALWLFISIIVIYCILVFGVMPDEAPFLKYPLLAKQYISGEMDLNRIPDLSPLYFYFNVLVVSVFKSIPVSVTIIRLIQILIIGLTALYFFRIYQRHYSLRLSMIGIILFASSFSIVLYTKIIEPEPFVLFFLSGFLFYLSQKRSRKCLFYAGIFFALGVLTRSNFLPLALVIPFFLWISDRYRKLRFVFYKFLFFLLPVLLAIGFLIIRNYSIRGEFSPYAADPGYVLFEGNNPISSGQSATYPTIVYELTGEFPDRPDFQHQVYKMVAEKVQGKPLSVIESNDFWGQKAKNYIADYPLRFISLLSQKIHYFFHHYRRHDLNNAYRYDRFLHRKFPVQIPFWIISVLAIIGIFLSRREWRGQFMFLLIFFMQFLVLTLIYVSERQRIAILPFFIFFALYAIRYFYYNRRKFIFVTPIILLSFLFLGMKTDLMIEEDYLWEQTNRSYDHWIGARQDRQHFRIRSAEKRMADAIMAAPWLYQKRRLAYIPIDTAALVKQIRDLPLDRSNFSSQYSNAQLLIQLGQLDLAEAILERLYRSGYRFKRDYLHASDPLYYLGIIAEKRGNLFMARRYFEKALAASPGNPYILAHLFVLSDQDSYRDQLIRYFNRMDADFFIGEAYLNINRPDLARPRFEAVLTAFPFFRKGLVLYALTLGRLKQYKNAVSIYLKALKRRVDPVAFEKDILGIFKRWAMQEPGNPVSRFYLGMIQGQFGHLGKGIATLESLSQLDPDNGLIRKELLKLKKMASGPPYRKPDEGE